MTDRLISKQRDVINTEVIHIQERYKDIYHSLLHTEGSKLHCWNVQLILSFIVMECWVFYILLCKHIYYSQNWIMLKLLIVLVANVQYNHCNGGSSFLIKTFLIIFLCMRRDEKCIKLGRVQRPIINYNSMVNNNNFFHYCTVSNSTILEHIWYHFSTSYVYST